MKHNKAVLITGGNSGLGFEAAKEMARDSNWYVVIASRNQKKNTSAVEKIEKVCQNNNIISFKLNLGSIESIESFVKKFTIDKALPPLKAIICNAGVSISTETQFTGDGIEKTFGVNHLGHFYLVNLLLSHLQPESRIVCVSSGVHNRTQENAYMKGPRYINAQMLAYPDKYDQNMGDSDEEIGGRRYATSKLCNVFFAYELDRRLQANQVKAADGITVNVYTPGFMPGTDLGRNSKGFSRIMFKYIIPLFRPFSKKIISPKYSGSKLAQMVLSDEYKGISGKYFVVGVEEWSSPESYDLDKAAELWESTKEIIGEIKNS